MNLGFDEITNNSGILFELHKGPDASKRIDFGSELAALRVKSQYGSS